MTDKDLIHKSALFGEYSPYWYLKDGKACLCPDFTASVINLDRKILDPSAVLSLLNFLYIQGDRTLIQGLNKMPWHSDLLVDGTIVRHAPIPHGNQVMTAQQIADQMYKIMSTKIKEILSNHDTIWVTLSGGYDSRIVAGLVKKYSINNAIHALTWGIENCRDVKYAQKLSKEYGWDWTFIPIESSSSMETIVYTVKEIGAEVSGIDYNPLEVHQQTLEKIKGDDAILFAHYGDGIGRGEYSGKRLGSIPRRAVGNPFFLFNEKTFAHHKNTVEADRALAWLTDSGDAVAQSELDMHENYMRRMLTKRFKYCHKYDPFTNPKLAEFVYSLDPKCRTDETYDYLLKQIDPFLHAFPWARTGASFTGAVDTKNYAKNQHNKKQGYQLLHQTVSETLLNGELCAKNVLNKSAVKCLLGAWKKDPLHSVIVSKIFGIELLIKESNIAVDPMPKASSPLITLKACVYRFAKFTNSVRYSLLSR